MTTKLLARAHQQTQPRQAARLVRVTQEEIDHEERAAHMAACVARGEEEARPLDGAELLKLVFSAHRDARAPGTVFEGYLNVLGERIGAGTQPKEPAGKTGSIERVAHGLEPASGTLATGKGGAA